MISVFELMWFQIISKTKYLKIDPNNSPIIVKINAIKQGNGKLTIVTADEEKELHFSEAFEIHWRHFFKEKTQQIFYRANRFFLERM